METPEVKIKANVVWLFLIKYLFTQDKTHTKSPTTILQQNKTIPPRSGWNSLQENEYRFANRQPGWL